MNTDHVDSALGALLGACIGDAAGATLEFLGRTPTQEEVLQALTLPGGGFFHLSPGQITDDGELTLCLAHALAQSKRFDLEPIARRYADWVRSKPFDIGNTTRQSWAVLWSLNGNRWSNPTDTPGQCHERRIFAAVNRKRTAA